MTGTAAPAAGTQTPPRTVIEFCTSNDSELCNSKRLGPHDRFVRLTINDDMSTTAGLKAALIEVRNAKGHIELHGLFRALVVRLGNISTSENQAE